MPKIIFEKRRAGAWRRDDGESKLIVPEERMYREIQKLQKDGWKIKDGSRKIEVFR